MAKKTSKNIVEEWAKEILGIAKSAYSTSYASNKNEYIMKIIGSCETIITTLDCCDNENS